ncbi:MAG: 3-hydroxyacyl-CoA dehydrogenase NAD-binding domain-containing protein [Cellvibrionaceae bacterium]
MSVVNYQVENNIGIIRVNNPPVNALSQALRIGIQDAIKTAQNDDSKAIVILCEGRTFIAGADITEFGKPPMAPSLPDVVEEIEQSTKPVIAALHGTALGGGLEVALGSHYRVALASAKVGLPEVKLGLLPGAGGTQRTPRLTGVKAALDLMTSGNPIGAGKAQSINLIDEIVEGDLLAGAVTFAEKIIAQNAPIKRSGQLNVDDSDNNAEFFAAYRKNLARRAKGQIAPQNIVSCVEAAANQSLSEGLKVERDLFMECITSPQSAAMRHMFFAEREAAKVKGLAKDTPLREIKSVGIIGGGTMGGGIAMNFANVGIPVKLLEISDEGLKRGLGIIEKNYAISAKKGKLTEQQMQQCLSLVEGTTNYDDLNDVDLVIEAVFENINIKKEVFTKLDQVCKPGAILATNTSYQDVDQIAAATQRPEDVIGLHFFSPANVMKLLEIVRGEKTADDVIATCMKIAKTIRKVPVLARVCYGFIGNRMLQPYFREAQLCLIEGSTPEKIDSVMEEFGMAMGPIAVSDLAGIDIGYKARETLSDDEKGPAKTFCVSDALVEMDRLGQKSGAGFYTYDPQTRQRMNDDKVMEIVETQAKLQGIERRDIDEDELLKRMTFGLINEGAKVLEEGIAQRPSDIDVVYIYGYGYPVSRGGPMHYADSIGLKTIYETICQYAQDFGEEFWQPSALLKQLAEEGKTFAQWAQES